MSRPWSVNKARRLEAVNACEQMASSNDAWGIAPVHSVQANVHVKTPIAVLAQEAFNAVFNLDHAQHPPLYTTTREMWAEAACILEMGWTPGDELILKSTQLEEKFDAQVDAKSAAMDAAGVPTDAENVQLEETETMLDVVGHYDGPQFDTSDAAKLADEMRNGTATFTHSEEDHTDGCTERCSEEAHEIDLSTVQAGEAMRDLSDEEKAEVSAAFEGIDRGVAEENLAGTKLEFDAVPNFYGDTTGDTGE